MARPKTEAADYKGFMVRLPTPLLQRLRDRASKERRSINAQLVVFLEDLLPEKKENHTHDLVGSRNH